jgi:hypothetical protein
MCGYSDSDMHKLVAMCTHVTLDVARMHFIGHVYTSSIPSSPMFGSLILSTSLHMVISINDACGIGTVPPGDVLLRGYLHLGSSHPIGILTNV